MINLDSFETTDHAISLVGMLGKRVLCICDAGLMIEEPAIVQAAPTLLVSSLGMLDRTVRGGGGEGAEA
jgi:hypothetical protein